MRLISVIIGSTREGRFSEKSARWIYTHLQSQPGIQSQLLDLRDHPLPFFDQPIHPSAPGRAPYKLPVVGRWTAEIARSDGFIIATPEYNHGVPAVLKNALDWVYGEWSRKPVGFVSHGSASGARSVEHLRGIVIALQMMPIRAAVQIPIEALRAHFQGGDVSAALAKVDDQARAMIGELLW